MFGTVAHCTELHFSRTRRHTNHHADAGGEKVATGAHHVDEAAHHLFAGVKVRNHAIVQRANHTDFLAGLFIHELRTLTHCDSLLSGWVECHYRRLVHGNLTIRDNDGVCCAEVHGKLTLHREKGRKNSHCQYFALFITQQGASLWALCKEKSKLDTFVLV